MSRKRHDLAGSVLGAKVGSDVRAPLTLTNIQHLSCVSYCLPLSGQNSASPVRRQKIQLLGNTMLVAGRPQKIVARRHRQCAT
ncbi:hypothetical protein BaRGS_00032077 [Batillaria attramentaria]|uniref:Uncharacterized protein n=1 Tax=Batillaria attramentaria TaxID=370345 RepID=A0ABD0JPM1_9CAEN